MNGTELLMPELPITTDNKKNKDTSHNKLKGVIKGKKYSLFILCIILCDFLMMGILTMKLNDFWINTLSIIDFVIQAVFIVDIILYFIAYGWSFFKDAWKIIDLFTTIVTTIPLGSFSQYTKFIRSFRVLRVLRVFSRLKYLRFLIIVLGKAIPQVAWTILMQLILFYCYSVIGTMIFGEKFPAWFGSIWLSLYTLFQVMTLESWSMGIARPVIAEYQYAWIYFVTFVILSSFILMNIVVGIVVNTIETTTEEEMNKEFSSVPKDKQQILNLIKQLKEVQAVLEDVIKENSNDVEKDMKNPEILPVKQSPQDNTTVEVLSI